MRVVEEIRSYNQYRCWTEYLSLYQLALMAMEANGKMVQEYMIQLTQLPLRKLGRYAAYLI